MILNIFLSHSSLQKLGAILNGVLLSLWSFPNNAPDIIVKSRHLEWQKDTPPSSVLGNSKSSDCDCCCHLEV